MKWSKTRAVALWLAVLAALALVAGLTAQTSQATPVGQSITIIAVTVTHHPSPPPPMQQQSQRNIGPNQWDRSTVIIQVMKAGDSLEQTWFHERVSYYRNVAGSTLNILEQSCVVNMSCIRVYFDFYGSMGGNDGLTTEAYTDCLSINAWCRYDGTSSNITHTTVQFTRNDIDAYTYNQDQSVFCHELGHAIADLQHASGTTCMQAAGTQYTGLTAAEAQSVRDKYTGLARIAPMRPASASPTQADHELVG